MVKTALLRVLLLFAVCLTARVGLAQSDVGGATINGTVSDPSGAAIAGARVTASNPATGFTRTTQTNESGLYTFTRLPPGSYDLTVENQGFKISRRSGLQLNVGAVATIDVLLEVGTA